MGERKLPKSFEGSQESGKADTPPGEPATVTDASKQNNSIRDSQLIHMRGTTGRTRPARAHKDARLVTDAAGPANTRHRLTHTRTEHRIGPKAPHEWAGRQRAEDLPGPRSSQGRARRFLPNSIGRPLAGARGRLPLLTCRQPRRVRCDSCTLRSTAGYVPRLPQRNGRNPRLVPRCPALVAHQARLRLL